MAGDPNNVWLRVNGNYEIVWPNQKQVSDIPHFSRNTLPDKTLHISDVKNILDINDPISVYGVPINHG